MGRFFSPSVVFSLCTLIFAARRVQLSPGNRLSTLSGAAADLESDSGPGDEFPPK